jgi:hypothetical protein
MSKSKSTVYPNTASNCCMHTLWSGDADQSGSDSAMAVTLVGSAHSC